MINFRYFSSFFLASSSNSWAVIPCVSIACFLAFSNNYCSVLFVIVWEQFGSPASLQFIDNIGLIQNHNRCIWRQLTFIGNLNIIGVSFCLLFQILFVDMSWILWRNNHELLWYCLILYWIIELDNHYLSEYWYILRMYRFKLQRYQDWCNIVNLILYLKLALLTCEVNL